MKRTFLTVFCSILIISSCASGVSRVDRITCDSRNAHYVSNADPLVPQQFIKLPVGTVKAGGWLLRQLELQRDGLNGHLGEISAWLDKSDNAWLTTGGKWGWEEVPYWLRGYAALGYSLGDEAILTEARGWIDAIIASQREDGNFGPAIARKTQYQDYWPNMLVLWILQDWYEYTGDERVLSFMTRYCHYLETVPDEGLFASYWENSRGGDNLWSVAWLYNRTGEAFLLPLAEKIHRNTANWAQDTNLPNWHNVNIAQCFREPATWYMFGGDQKMLQATYNDYFLVRRAFGQMPGGMFAADENARPGYIDPRQGTETCGFAEQMASDEILTLITGDPLWAENLEDVAFNSYPAALMPDLKALRYLTSANMAISDAKNHRPSIQNGGPMVAMNPFSSRCCQHNHGFAWPYYSQYLALATPDNGVGFTLYNDCSARVKVGDSGQEVTFTEQTHYPFDERIRITVQTDKAVSFPLYLRIPSWCKRAVVRCNGRNIAAGAGKGNYLRVERNWRNGDRIDIRFAMDLSMRRWDVNQGSVSVDYGPLTLSLKIKEEYRRVDTRSTVIGDSKWQAGANAADWPTYEILPGSDWNYALCLGKKALVCGCGSAWCRDIKLRREIKLRRGTWPADGNPFTAEGCPLQFRAKGRLVPSWGYDATGFTAVLPSPCAPRSDRVDDITLIPMGAARLRISAFPPAE